MDLLIERVLHYLIGNRNRRYWSDLMNKNALVYVNYHCMIDIKSNIHGYNPRNVIQFFFKTIKCWA